MRKLSISGTNLSGKVLLATLVLALSTELMAAQTDEFKGVSCSTNRDLVGGAGRDYIKNGDWDRAIAYYSEVLGHDPKNVSAFEWRGCCYFAKGYLKEAIDDFTAVIRLEPTNSEAYYNRGSARLRAHELDQATADLDGCLRLNATNHVAYEVRALIRNERQDYAGAIRDWDEGLRLNPTDPKAFVFRGWEYFMVGRFDDAVRDYNQAIRLDPTNILAYNNLAWLRATSPDAAARNGAEAVVNAMKACNLSGWQRWTWIDTLAASYAEQGDFHKAVEYESKAIKMPGPSPDDLEHMQQNLLDYQEKRPNHHGQYQ